MKHIIDDQVVLSRPLEGPLATQIAAFTRYAREEGYALQSRFRLLLLAAGFSRWLAQQAVRLSRVSSDHPNGTCDLALDGCRCTTAMRPR